MDQDRLSRATAPSLARTSQRPASAGLDSQRSRSREAMVIRTKKRCQAIWKKSNGTDLVNTVSNAKVEAKHLYDLRATGQDPRQILSGIEFTPLEIEILKKTRGLGGHDFRDAVRFRQDVAAEFRKLMVHELVIAELRG